MLLGGPAPPVGTPTAPPAERKPGYVVRREQSGAAKTMPFPMLNYFWHKDEKIFVYAVVHPCPPASEAFPLHPAFPPAERKQV